QCGEMIHPPASLDVKTPAICDATQFNAYVAKVNDLKAKIGKGVPDMPKVKDAISSLGDSYKHYADKKKPLKDTAKQISAGLLGQFREPLLDRLNNASTCVHDPKWWHADLGCWMISTSCFDRVTIEWQMKNLDPLIKELQDDVSYNWAMLDSGLPTNIT